MSHTILGPCVLFVLFGFERCSTEKDKQILSRPIDLEMGHKEVNPFTCLLTGVVCLANPDEILNAFIAHNNGLYFAIAPA